MVPEVARDQRRVVVAQVRAEPGEPPDRSLRLDGERQNKQERAMRIAAKHDRGTRVSKIANMLLPLGQPFECLKNSACGRALERRPFRLQGSELVAELECDARARVARLGRGE